MTAAAISCAILCLASTAEAGFFPAFRPVIPAFHPAMPFLEPSSLLVDPFHHILSHQPSRTPASFISAALDEFAAELRAAESQLRESRQPCATPEVKRPDGSIQFTLPLEGHKPDQLTLEVDTDTLRLRYGDEAALERIVQLPAPVENASAVSAVISDKGCLQITLPPSQPAAWHPVPISIPAAVHHGICCDKSRVCPIVGTRYTRPGQDYDLSEQEFLKLSTTEQAGFVAIQEPVPAQEVVRQAEQSKPAEPPVPAEEMERRASEKAERQMREKLAELEKMFASTKDQLEEAVRERRAAAPPPSESPAEATEEQEAAASRAASATEASAPAAAKPSAPKQPSSAPKPSTAPLWRALAKQAVSGASDQEPATPKQAEPVQNIMQQISVPDLDGDGLISLQELHAHVQATQPKVAKQPAQ